MGVRHGSDRPERLRFGNFEVDLDSGELRKNGLRVKLPNQAFEVLTALLERAGEVVTREQLQQKLWPADTLVDFDHGLNKTINRIREALCDSASDTPIPRDVAPARVPFHRGRGGDCIITRRAKAAGGECRFGSSRSSASRSVCPEVHPCGRGCA